MCAVVKDSGIYSFATSMFVTDTTLADGYVKIKARDNLSEKPFASLHYYYNLGDDSPSPTPRVGDEIMVVVMTAKALQRLHDCDCVFLEEDR